MVSLLWCRHFFFFYNYYITVLKSYLAKIVRFGINLLLTSSCRRRKNVQDMWMDVVFKPCYHRSRLYYHYGKKLGVSFFCDIISSVDLLAYVYRTILILIILENWWLFLRAIQKSNCHRKNGEDSPCMFSNIPHIIGFGIVEILLSQLPNFHKLSWLSKLAALMSFVYTSIGIGLSIAKIVSGKFSSIC